MAINKAMRAALAVLSYPEIDVKKTYRLERKLQKITVWRLRKPQLYRIWEHTVPWRSHEIPVRIFTPSKDAVAAAGSQGISTAMTTYAPIWRLSPGAPWSLWTTVWLQNTAFPPDWRTATL